MQAWKLKQKGIEVIDGQRNWYNPKIDLHQRSYLCARMRQELFDDIKQYLGSYGVSYITQTNFVWDMQGAHNKKNVWVTKVKEEGTVYIGLTDDKITLNDDEVYVVMWNRRFLPKLIWRGRSFDIDTILLQILDGLERPFCCYPLRIIAASLTDDRTL